MNIHADKTQENKSQSTANALSQKQSNSESTFQFEDNRLEAVAQRKMQEITNKSLQVSQLRAFQYIANNSPQAKQAVQLQVVGDHSSQEQKAIQNEKTNSDINLVAQRKVSIRYLLNSVTDASNKQVLHFLGSNDREYGTTYRSEILGSPSLLKALEWVLTTDTTFAYGFLEAGSLMRKLRDRASIVGPRDSLFAEQRIALLDKIRDTYFKGTKPKNVLYLGAGGDTENPSISTRSSKLTLVDSADFNIPGIKASIKAYHGPDVVIEETSLMDVVTALIVKDSEGETVLQTIDLRKMGYQAYLDTHDDEADVLFDKDSWLKDAGPKVVTDYLSKLKPKGLWISNFDLGGPELVSLFNKVGLVNVKPALDAPFDNATFGNSGLEIRQKQDDFNQAAFSIMSDFSSEVNTVLSLFNYPEYTFFDQEEKTENIEVVTKAIGKALVRLIMMEDFPESLALEFVKVGRNITSKLQGIELTE